ncbi:hypothetical protein [Gimesia sp.]|uniref:hypothetical protein n=1 Tax=Gimesia sp. TaxID=2024833 RepID=UPI001E1A4A13|nr:hypothetical protein [Planctomycetaceae bacterium]
MFGILNETILAIFVLLTRVVRILPTLMQPWKSTRSERDFYLHVESLTQQTEENEMMRRVLSCLGIEQRLRVPVKVRSDRWCFKRR